MNENFYNGVNQWTPIKTNIFWDEIASQSHTFHVYENENQFLNLLAGFVGTGINANDCSIVIATTSHLEKLQKRLKLHGLNVSSLIEDGKYTPISAETMLLKFIKNGLPDENLFVDSIAEIIGKTKYRNRKIRIFREMAPLLILQGNIEATTQLETLWSKYRHSKLPSFFCAYPKSTFIGKDCNSVKQIGFQNSKFITGSDNLAEVRYIACS